MPQRRNDRHTQYRTKPSYQHPPRFQPQTPFYTPPPLRNDFRWQQPQPPPQQRHQPVFIPPQIQFQLQQRNLFNCPQQSIPRMLSWRQPEIRQVPIQPLMSLPYRKQYYEEPQVPVRQIIPVPEPIPFRNHREEQEIPAKQILPEVEPIPQIISDKKDVSSESIQKEMENLSIEAVRSSNDSSNSNYEKNGSDGPIFETTERPGPKESALPKFDLNDPIYAMINRSNLLNAGDTIERSLIPEELANGEVFGLFIAEVNSPSKFWFHLQSQSADLDDLMFDLE